MRWWPSRDRPPAVPEPTNEISIADPHLVEYFTPGGLVDLAGVAVNQTSAIGLTALYRALALISGTLAGLPMPTWRQSPDGTRKQVESVFDEPDGPEAQTLFEWKESLLLHLLLHGKAGALKIRTQAGSIARLPLVHPLSFQVVQPTIAEYRNGTLPVGGVWFDVSLDNGFTPK